MQKGRDTGIVNIHGKEYQTVAYRVGKFREIHGLDLFLTTEIVSRDAECVVMKATITNPEGKVVATGHSEEYRNTSQINRTSALENAETSAIGRALAALGIGGTEFATADEVANAIAQQKRGHSPADGALAALSKEDQETAREIAAEIVDLWETDKHFAAYERFYEANLTNEMMLGVWELLRPNSKARNGIKKLHEENKSKPEQKAA